MSRTTRHIPQWVIIEKRGKCRYIEGWKGIGNYHHEIDPRSPLYHGRDYGKARSYIYSSYPTTGWPENYQNKTRKFFKRNYHKTRRLFDKMMVRELVKDGE